MAALGFSNLTSDNLERVRDFASLAFNNILKCSREQVESRWLDEIAELLSNEQAAGLVAQMRGTTNRSSTLRMLLSSNISGASMLTPGFGAPPQRGFTRNGFGRAQLAGLIGFSSPSRAIASQGTLPGNNLPL